MLTTNDRAKVDFVNGSLVYETGGTTDELFRPELSVVFRSPSDDRVHEFTFIISTYAGSGVASHDLALLHEALQSASSAVLLKAMNQSENSEGS